MRACILSVSGPVLTADEKDLLSTMQPWGVILMGRSCVSKKQVQRLVDEIWGALERACLIFIDQEGGRVARLKAPEWPIFPAGGDYAALYAKNTEHGLEATWLGHRLIGHELASLSIHANCAPVLDRRVEGAHDIVGDRALGATPEEIALLGRQALKGLRDSGVAGVIKHIPGHGRAMADSHVSLPRVTAGDNELAQDFASFTALLDAPMAMMAHIAYDAFDAERPATLSPTVISGVIRERIGFQGLLMSDDLGMKALGGRLGERASRAIEAGCDIALHCSGFIKDPDEILTEMREVAEATPILAGQALVRAEHAQSFATLAKPFDVEAGYARLAELFGTAQA